MPRRPLSRLEFVVPLSLRPDRRLSLARSLARHGASRVEFFEAVSGSSVVSRDPERWRDRMKTDELDPLPYAEGALAPPH